MLRNGKSQAGPPYFSRPVLVDTIETFKDPRKVLVGNARTVVRYGKLDRSFAFVRTKNNCCAVWAIFYRIAHNVPYGLTQPFLIAERQHFRELCLHCELLVFFSRLV